MLKIVAATQNVHGTSIVINLMVHVVHVASSMNIVRQASNVILIIRVANIVISQHPHVDKVESVATTTINVVIAASS